MNGEFDAQTYTNALQNVIIKLEQIHEADSPRLSEVVGEFASLLGAGAVEAVIFDDTSAEQRGDGSRILFYDSGNAARTNTYFSRQLVGPGRVVHYTVYPVRGKSAWTEEETGRLEVLVNLLNVFNRRMLSIRLGQFYATHEQNFGMYNVSFFLRKIGEYSARGILDEFAACQFNIRRMSFINGEFGRAKGTELIRSFLKEIEKLLTDKREILCRIGGDNFAVLFRKDHLDAVTACLEGAFVAENEADGSKIMLSAWAGVFPIPKPSMEPSEVMDRIAFTVKAARTGGLDKALVFDAQILERFEWSKRVQSVFADAVRKEEFKIFYQPKVTLKDYQIVGAEALCRWEYDGRLLKPYQFVPAFEQGSQICQLDFYMLEHVCRDIRRWLDEGRKMVRVSINFSRRHFGDRDFLEHILDIIDRNRVPHKYIEIELTETSTEVKFRELQAFLEGLKRHGIHSAVDDFGSGYSSLSLIRDLPWDVLKLDKSFLSSKNRNRDKEQMMFGHVVSMARELGMECITEGVESVEQVRFLKENNCFLAQGFYFDQPLPAHEFEQKLDMAE